MLRWFGVWGVKDQHLWIKKERNSIGQKEKSLGPGCSKTSAALGSKYCPSGWMLMGSNDFKVLRLPLWPGRPPSEAILDNLRPSPRLSVDSRSVSAPFTGVWDMQLCLASKWTLRLSSAPLAPERTWSPERNDRLSSLFLLLECPAGSQDVSLMKCRVCLQ